MGGGEILESGTHNDLLNSSDGAYARLVLAQKLAAATEKEEALGGAAEADNSSDEHLTLDGQTPVGSLSRADSAEGGEKLQEQHRLKLERTATGGASLSSQVLADRKQRNVRDDSAMSYRVIGPRMAAINRESWRLYILGFIASVLSGCVYRASSFSLPFFRGTALTLRFAPVPTSGWQRPSASCTGEPSPISASLKMRSSERNRTGAACGSSSWLSSRASWSSSRTTASFDVRRGDLLTSCRPVADAYGRPLLPTHPLQRPRR